MVPDDSYWHVALPDKPEGVKGRSERKLKKRRNQPKCKRIGTKGEAPKDQYGVIVSSDLNRQIVTVKWYVNCDTLDDAEKKFFGEEGVPSVAKLLITLDVPLNTLDDKARECIYLSK